MGWNAYERKRTDFNYLVGLLSEKKFDNVELMLKLIKSYGLEAKESRIPRTFDECKIFLEKYLFVNIYDFISDDEEEKKIKFNNLQELKNYTKMRNLYFPLNQAKNVLAYRILLRHLLD